MVPLCDGMPRNLSRNQRSASLEKRVFNAASALYTIKNDHKRDCKPWYKYDRLNLDLMEIASDVEKLEATSRRAAVKIAKAAEQIKAMKKKLEANGA